MDRIRGNRRMEGKQSNFEGDGKKRVEIGSVIALPLDVRKNSPINILKRSIRRAWTINGPPGGWTISRKSPAFRIYRSLPLSRNNNNKSESVDSLKKEIDPKISSLKTETLNLRNKSNTNENDSIQVRGTLAKPIGKNFQKYIPESKASPKYGERRSNIPIYRRNSREFEDIASPRESPRRSLIPQRYRGSTDDLRRYREDGNIPSLIPKLAQKSKDEKSKREKLEIKSSLNIKKELRERDESRLRYSPTNFRQIPRSEENLWFFKCQSEAKIEVQESENIDEEFLGETKDPEDFETQEIIEVLTMANEKMIIDECHDVKNSSNDEKQVSGDSSEDRDSGEGEKSTGINADVMDTSNTSAASDAETPGINTEDIKNMADGNQFKRSEEIQVIRRKYSKEEFSNTDDTDDAPNRRSSSHLSPEASPLSTRSSRYSPRESESEPTPALPRKTQSGESSISSQRIRDAITRTRRESNSSTRYESSGSESIRLSESGLHGYVDLARKVRLFGSSHCCSGASIDEPIRRDSATSAGEDEPHDDCLSRDPGRLTGPSTQGRTILRRRRQFDAQGSRRRGRSHARTCCSEEFSNLQATRQCSQSQGSIPTHSGDHHLNHLNPDYRRLVFISSDSSSGREEDDADSSCSSSSYLNGLPRGNHAQGLEDCDWDYFESGTLPLPTSLRDSINIDGITNVRGNRGIIRDWSCCPGRGSACLACGGSTGANVLPVPVPIPVPVPYPVPIPAALWNGDFAAAASSMITGSATPEGTLRLRGDPTAPWFSWHPRFTHPLDGTVQRGSRMPSGGFDPSIFTFRPDGLSLGQFENIKEPGSLTEAAASKEEKSDQQLKPDKQEKSAEVAKPFLNDENSSKIESSVAETSSRDEKLEPEDPLNLFKDVDHKSEEESTNEDSASSSGRSSADSSDLDESASHHFSRVFVVNDDSLTSDNDMEEIADIDEEAKNPKDSGIILKRMIPLSDDEQSVVLRRIRLFDKDLDGEKTSGDSETSGEWMASKDLDHTDGNKSIIHGSSEIYLADSIDYSDNNHVQLRSIRNINSEFLEPILYPMGNKSKRINVNSSLIKPEDPPEEKSWDSTVTPDSLEPTTSNTIHSRSCGQPISSDNLSSTTCDSLKPQVVDAKDDVKLNSSTDSSETNTTSEFSSDELHEYEVTSYVKSAEHFVEKKLLAKGVPNTPEKVSGKRSNESDEYVHKTTPFPKSFPTPNDNTLNHNEAIKISQSFSSEIKSFDILQNSFDESAIIDINIFTSNDSSKAMKLNVSCIDSEMREVVTEKRGEKTDGIQVGDSEANCDCSGGNNSGERDVERGKSRYRSVERRPPTRKENGEFSPTTFTTAQQPIGGNNFGSSNKYKSLVMITQGTYQPVSVVTSDTTTLLEPDNTQTPQGLAGYYHLALEAVTEPTRNGQGPRRPLMIKRLAACTQEQEIDSGLSVGSASESDDVQSVKNTLNFSGKNDDNNEEKDKRNNDDFKGVNSNSNTGIVILEEGLADDDSWVEDVSHDEDEQSATATEESSEDEANNLGDREEELRGYHRHAIDFTLHTIVEESCEESEAELSLHSGNLRRHRPPSTSELEKYFFFGLGGDVNTGNGNSGLREVDSLSETSSIYSEGLESLGQDEIKDKTNDFASSSRLEKYFLSEFLGFDQDRRDSDGSVGSDSEGRPSPEAQRRKRLVRARGTGRSHSSSLDNLLALTQSSQNLTLQNSLQDLSMNQDSQETLSEGSSTETDGAEDNQTAAFGTDGQFDTVKRKKKKPRNLGTQSPRVAEDRSNKSPEPRDSFGKSSETLNNDEQMIHSDDERSKTPQPDLSFPSSSTSTSSSSSSPDNGSNFSDSRGKQQSRDSGFVGSCDDLLQHRKSPDPKFDGSKDHSTSQTKKDSATKSEFSQTQNGIPPTANPSLSRKDSFNNWSSDEETNLMMSKMRQFFKTMVANSNGQPTIPTAASNSSGPSPIPSPRLSGFTSEKSRMCPQNRTKPPQLVYFENELTRLMKTVPGIRDEQVREIVEYLSSEDTWSDSYDSSDYTSSDLEGAGGRRSALQEQISQSCQQIINKFDLGSDTPEKEKNISESLKPQSSVGRDTAFVYQKLVQSFTKMTGDGVSSDASSTPHSSPPLIAKVMHHIGSRLVALMHEVSEGTSTVQHHSNWRRYSQHHRTPSSASTTEDDESTSDSTGPSHFQLPRSKSHDPLLLINGHPAATAGQEGEEREASDYERFSWRGSFESALMAADSRTKLSLLACSGDVNASASASALAMAAKRRSAGDLLFNPKSFSREQLDRVRSCGSIGGGNGNSNGIGSGVSVGSIEEKIWSNRRRSSVPDANTRGESGASAGDEDTEDEMEYNGDPRATTLPRGMQVTTSGNAATNSLPRLPASTATGGANVMGNTTMHKAHSMYHFLPQHSNVKSARYRPPGFARNSLSNSGAGAVGPKRAFSAPGLQIPGGQAGGKRESRSRRQQTILLAPDDGSSLSEACSTPIIGSSPRSGSSRTVMDIDDTERGGLHSAHHLNTRASLSSLGARSDSMASVYSGAGEGRWCGSVAVRGEVEFSLQYNYKQLTFEVHVSQCKDLAPVDIKRNRSDPYVKVYLLPDKSKGGKRKTKVKKHTLNPVFDETLKFHIALNGLETRTLWLTVWHSDMFGRNDFLGEVRMPLENKIFDDPTPRWYPLQERTEPFDDPVAYKGEVIVGLKFVPPDPAQLQEKENINCEKSLVKGKKNWSRGALHVLVKEARNLQTRAKNTGTCDPFCKSYLLPDKGRSGKQKTGVVRRSGGSPVWAHTFVYKDVSIQELAERGLELTVWDHDRIASNEFLGGVRFNLGTGKHYGKPVDWMDATGRELSLWQSMLERPNFWVEGAVTLRPNLHNHGKSTVS